MAQQGYDYARIGENIRKQRRASQLTQAELARRAGCSVRAVSVLEKGDCSLSVRLFIDLCRALDCMPAELLQGVE